MIGRREFITLLGGATAAWPLGARAQQPTMPVIGFLDTRTPDAVGGRLRAFRQGLREAGYVEGESVAIEYRWAEGKYERLPEMAAELARHPVTAIVTTSTYSTLAAKAATTKIPIVFLTAADPVQDGLVASLNRPGGNLTGINFVTAELTAKRLDLLRELVPTVDRVAVLVNPANVTTTEATLRDVAPAARAIGLRIQVFNAGTSREIDAAFAAFASGRFDAVFVGIDQFLISRRAQLVNLASRHALPATFPDREFPEIGGLMSYGASIPDAYRQMGTHVGRVLKGAKPADLPVVQASKFELVINAQTARMLDLAVPDKLLALADEVIE
jgi:putative ABC transport system substrate-binding protein